MFSRYFKTLKILKSPNDLKNEIFEIHERSECDKVNVREANIIFAGDDDFILNF